MSIDVFRDLPALDDHLQALAESSRGRMARVVSADGHMVTVEVPRKGGWDGPLGPYPATSTGLEAEQLGVLIPLRGSGALFVAVGVPGPLIPIHFYQQGQLTSTAVNAIASLGVSFAVTIPVPGRYRVDVSHFAAQVKRSVDSGGSELALYLSGAPISNAQLHTDTYTNVPATGDDQMTGGGAAIGYGGSRDVVTTTENQNLTFSFYGTGRNTAGTTYWSGIVVSGWYQRIT